MGDELLLVTVVPSQLYFDKESLLIDAPSEKTETVKLPLFDSVTLTYNLSSPFFMPSSSCNVSLHLKKPRLSILREVIVSYYDADGREITLAKKNLFGFWKEKVITMSGAIEDTGSGIAGIKIGLRGFSLRGISIVYGGINPSSIDFLYLS
jgi:hypothetical protein